MGLQVSAGQTGLRVLVEDSPQVPEVAPKVDCRAALRASVTWLPFEMIPCWTGSRCIARPGWAATRHYRRSQTVSDITPS